MQTIATRLSASVRASDTAARLGGDEFVLILSNVGTKKSLGRVADKILQSIAKPVITDHHQLQVHASIGISLFPVNAPDTAALIKTSDRAMYEAKKRGNAFEFYTDDLGD